MNKKWKEAKKTYKNSPDIFEDEEVNHGTSSQDEVNNKSSKNATPKSKSFSGHSTPIQCKSSLTDSPDLMYESPIEPLTQHPPNEVGWDYQRPSCKDEILSPVSNSDISRTPKRRDLNLKKRNSNSPLLYKPLKKKLMQEEQNHHALGFIDELKEIAQKAKRIGEKKNDVSEKTDGDIGSQLVVEMDSQPSGDSDIKLQVSANSPNDSPNQKKEVIENKNYDTLMDESIEQCMALCSQEVEAKVFGTQKVPEMKAPIVINPQIKSSPDTKLANMFRNLSKENLFKENLKPPSIDKALSDTSSKDSSTKESGSLEIPDDSFDDIFADLNDEEFSKTSKNTAVNNFNASASKPQTKVPAKPATSSTLNVKSSSSQNKFFTSKNAAQTTKVTVPASVSNTPYYTSNPTVQNKVVNTKASFGYLSKECVKNNTSSSLTQTATCNKDKNNDVRLFKSKSLSDSHFLKQNSSTSNCSNYKSNSMQFNNQNSETGYASIRRSTSSLSIGKSSYGTSHQSNTNKFTNSEASQSTPAEIELKRREAIMRREEKIKMKCQNSTLSRPKHNFVKR